MQAPFGPSAGKSKTPANVSAGGEADKNAPLSMSDRLLVLHTSPTKIPATTHVIVLAVEEARKLGIAPAAVLEGARLRMDELDLPSTVITREQELKVFSNLQQLSGDSTMGLEIGQRVHVSSFGLPGYTMLVSQNLREAVACMSAFPLLMGLYHTVRIRDGSTETSVAIDNYGYSLALEVMTTDMCLSAVKTVVEDLMGFITQPSRVAVRYAKPSEEHIRKHQEFYGCDVEYGASENSIYYRSKVFEAKAPLANMVSFHALYAQCEELERQWATKASDDCLLQVRQLLENNLATYSSLARVSEKLCVTERTLRRRLEHQGCTFQHLLDQVRHDRACLLFADASKSIANIAQELGYSDTVSFRHAFRRWTGKSPSEYRSGLGGH
ncbi:AraC family transcriptional regulator [Pseudomonas aeruginosa]|uniref:AraC family transcriptional regulator n=1 Tax=Pseudomonas aeruginosa TaxID=287 RepID=UPI0009A7B869|nr:AraC family transcriptional regulator [Pseudomonas aeruginosa]MBI8451486.1 AraC family transcriptional regulator [Pseudomonas aeruginosa]TEF29295.1 AraC family transcriptional regulator [Pseudomonas aeruginosa]TEF37108.1 AraC family transcriptional regulator [Pseudomonas aeruginosa]SOV26209.1 CFA/I fimbrial subunit D [Pseudomonas aeruginosa]HEJ2566239.1 AraC family transcriptional regulator [Pseudomonas aeruginosa]